MSRVLIAYGSKRGGTEGLAGMLADALRSRGVAADVRPARSAGSVDDYDGVVVAGSLYANRWHADARRLVRRQGDALRGRPVWLVSSGPLDDTADGGGLPPVRQVAKLAARVGARGTVTFGGRLEREPQGYMAAAMAKDHAGDWRNPAQVDAFAAEVAAAVSGVGADR